MKPKTILALLAVGFAAGSTTVLAQTPAAPAAAAPSFTTTITTAVVSQYMFRGQRYGGPSFEPSVEVAYGNLGLGVWANLPLKDKVAGTSDPEVDPYGYYNLNLSDTFSVVPGFTLYTYPRAPLDQGFYRTTFEPSLALNYTYEGIKLTPRLYYDFVLEAVTAELSVGYAMPLKELGTEVDFLGTYGTYLGDDVIKNAHPSVKAWGDYWQAGLTLPFQLSKESKVSVGFAYAKGSAANFKQGSAPKFGNSLAVGRGVVTLSYTCSF